MSTSSGASPAAGAASTAKHSDNTVYIYLVYSLVVLYALCYQFQRPIEPFLVDKLTADAAGDGDAAAGKASSAIAYGRVQSLFAFVQCIGSLVFGYLLDIFGVRWGLALNFSACALSYLLLSMTDSMEMLYLSKLPGIFVAGFLCAQAAIIKLTKPGDQRVTALGRLTTSYTIGGILGPYIGGRLGASGDYFFGARLAVGGSLVAVAIALMLPAHLDQSSSSVEPAEGAPGGEDKKAADGDKASPEVSSWFSRASLAVSIVWVYLFTKVVSSIANSVARSSQPLILKDDLHFDEAMMGTMMSAQFAFGGFSNMFLLTPLTKLLGGRISAVVVNCLVIMGASYGALALLFSDSFSLLPLDKTGRQYTFIGLTLFLAIFQYLLGTSITANTSRMVPKKVQGTLIGIEHSLFAIAYTVGPNVGSRVKEAMGIFGIGIVCASIFGFVLLVWLVFHKPHVGEDDDGSQASGKDPKDD